MVHTYKEIAVVSVFGETTLEYICERCGEFEGEDTTCKDLYPPKSKMYIEQALKAVAGR